MDISTHLTPQTVIVRDIDSNFKRLKNNESKGKKINFSRVELYNHNSSMVDNSTEIDKYDHSYKSHYNHDILAQCEELLNEIRTFTHLENNWDGYNAIPVSIKSCKNTIKLISVIGPDIFNALSDVFPNTHGTLTIEWENDSNKLSLEIGNTFFSYFLKKEGLNPDFYESKVFNNSDIFELKDNIKSIIG